MKFKFAMVAVCAAVLSAAITGQVLSQDPGAKPAGDKPGGAMPEGMPDMMAAMKKWEAAMKPGPHHKKLEHFVGTWETTMKMWMQGPGAPPSESKGVSTVRWVLDGRFIMDEATSQMPMPDMATGQIKMIPFKGMGMTGYDNYRNMYVGTWADNMGTQILNFAGSCDPSGKNFNYYGPMDEPMMDVHGRTVRYETRIVGPDEHVFTMYDLHAAPDYKAFEITYKRKK